MDYIAAIKEFGFPIAAALIIGYAYWRATSDRIKKLEQITTRQGVTIEELQEDRLKRAEGYANVLREISLKIGGALREQSLATKEQASVMRAQHAVLTEAMRSFSAQCQGRKHPSSADIPAMEPKPQDVPTDLHPTKL